jgi:hypothetical protein
MLIFDAPYFYAAVVLNGERVSRAAPILKYMVGWSVYRAIDYAERKGWRIFHVT